jgi:phenylacetate-coenzyme A ligase PaaK-like adenylate-forming protein
MPIVITRLREYPVWVTTDIVKFFHHVGVVEEDQMMLSYIWSSPGSTGPPEVWCMTRQPFGVVSSPFLSPFCLNRCAEDNKREFPLVVEQVKGGFYMTTTATRSLQLRSQNQDAESLIPF